MSWFYQATWHKESFVEENQGAGSEVWLSCLHDVCDKKAWAAHQKQVAERFPPKPNAIVKDTISSLGTFCCGWQICTKCVRTHTAALFISVLSMFTFPAARARLDAPSPCPQGSLWQGWEQKLSYTHVSSILCKTLNSVWGLGCLYLLQKGGFLRAWRGRGREISSTQGWDLRSTSPSSSRDLALLHINTCGGSVDGSSRLGKQQ